VKVVHAERRTVRRTVAQPGVINAYEQTAIYAKVSGYVLKWNPDIGDRVKKGDRLVELFAPELVEQHERMKEQVELDQAMVEQSRELVHVAESNLTAAVETVPQARADTKRYQADVDRWSSEVKRLTGLVNDKVVDQQVLDETRRQLASSQSAHEASMQLVKTRDAQRMSAASTLEKAKVDVSVAQAKVKVSQAEERRLAALVGYLKIDAPYDGVVYTRNVNSGDFVLPATGDPSEGSLSQGISPSRATPLYVLFRSDPVLFVVGVPESDAPYVAAGSKVRVRVPALGGREFTAKVTRTSWALNNTSRTLLAQVDLPNPKGEFLPGMYAYGSVFIERPDVRALPASAITQIGNQHYCYQVIDGKAVRTPVQIGVSDGSWVEVAGKHVGSPGSLEYAWVPFDGTEAIVEGDLSEISDGEAVKVDQRN
jgi:multidrug efflux pump subunit AcrA (membrane-fusion protein)